MEIKLALKVNDKDNVARNIPGMRLTAIKDTERKRTMRAFLPMALPMVPKLRSATKKATLKPLP